MYRDKDMKLFMYILKCGHKIGITSIEKKATLGIFLVVFRLFNIIICSCTVYLFEYVLSGTLNCLLGKPQKSYFPNGRAIKRRGGGKGPAIKEKKLFKNFFQILLAFNNKNNFTVDNLSKFWTYHVKVCR